MTPRFDPSYEEACHFLETFTDFSKSHSHETFETVAEDIALFRSVLRELGDPHLRYSVVHFAGSKGKGSTSSYIASILRAAGHRTGHLISPHLRDWTERVSVDGVPITRTEFGRLTAMLRSHLPHGRERLHRNRWKRVLQRLGLRPP